MRQRERVCRETCVRRQVFEDEEIEAVRSLIKGGARSLDRTGRPDVRAGEQMSARGHRRHPLPPSTFTFTFRPADLRHPTLLSPPPAYTPASHSTQPTPSHHGSGRLPAGPSAAFALSPARPALVSRHDPHHRRARGGSRRGRDAPSRLPDASALVVVVLDTAPSTTTTTADEAQADRQAPAAGMPDARPFERRPRRSRR